MRTIILTGLLLVATSVPCLAGSVVGPIKRTNTVQGFHTMTYKMRFTPGQPAVVVVQGDGDTPLMLLIVDAQGQRVAVDAKNNDRPEVRFTPASNDMYSVKILNRGGVPNRFRMQTN